MKQTWRDYFMTLATQVAKKSKDPSTQVGCVLVGPHENVLATGFNGLARKVQDLPERYADRELKLTMIVHAEANAVAAAARAGVNVYACTAVVTMPPCCQCAALLIQAGVFRVICPELNQESRWYHQNRLAVEMLTEAGVRVEFAHD
jgi:dCMP deaminase